MAELRSIKGLAVVLVLTLPWLNPFAGGPSPAVGPWLFSAACFMLFGALSALRPAGARGSLASGVAASWIVAAAASSAMGLLQYFDLARHLSPWVNVAPIGDAFANLRQRNQLATLTNIGLLALAWWIVFRNGPSKAGVAKPAWQSLLAHSTAILFAAGNAATASRTGLVQLALVALVMAWVARCAGRTRLGLRLSLIATAAYVAASIALPVLLEQLAGQIGGSAFTRLSEEPGCLSRKILWSNVLHLIAQRPWTGWGWGELDYAHFVTLYPGDRFCDILDNAHNLPLHLAVELGVPWAVLLCGGALLTIIHARPWSETDATRQLAWGVLAVIGLHSLLEYPLWYGPFQIATGLCIGSLWSTRNPWPEARGQATPKRRTVTRMIRFARVVLPASGLGLMVYAAWDYHRISQIYLPVEQRDTAYRDNTLNKVRDSSLFHNQVRFAELTVTSLTRENAAWMYRTAGDLLHYSPEPRVIERLIESTVMLERNDEALAWLIRYRAAFPDAHARWAKDLKRPDSESPPGELQPSSR